MVNDQGQEQHLPSDGEKIILDNGWLNEIGYNISLTLGAQKCMLKSIGKHASSSDKPPPEFSITLTCGNVTQTLWDIRRDADGFVDEPQLQLLWAGDADGDGKIDLYMDLSPKYSCGNFVEFDSSMAKPSELVGKSKRPIVFSCPD